MDNDIRYDDYEGQDFESLLKMGLNLWKDYARAELKRDLKRIISLNNHKVLIAKTDQNERIGFSIFSIRTDYVEGADKSPTGYLEGIYVNADFRNQGVAKSFLLIGEQWLKKNNCTQIGSDTWLNDTASRNFHAKLGFREEDELVHFLKDLA